MGLKARAFTGTALAASASRRREVPWLKPRLGGVCFVGLKAHAFTGTHEGAIRLVATATRSLPSCVRTGGTAIDVPGSTYRRHSGTPGCQRAVRRSSREPRHMCGRPISQARLISRARLISQTPLAVDTGSPVRVASGALSCVATGSPVTGAKNRPD